ncbi:MAG: hypothetical protein KJ601_07675 [Nanoarchaeota archaeon]|nr:hypothetical protein [Nanoarchaeota archaeon]
MQEYRPQGFINKWELILPGALFLIIGFAIGGDALPIMLAIGTAVIGLRIAIKAIFFKGQFNKILALQDKQFIIKEKGSENSYPLSEIKEFARYYVRKYGYKIHIKINENEIKFFTPDAMKIEAELNTIIGSSFKTKKTFLPHIGVKYYLPDTTTA